MKNRIFQFKFMLFNVCVVLLAGFSNPVVYCQIPIGSPGKTQVLLNEVVDISGDFRIFSNTYYLADSLSSFDPENGTGKVQQFKSAWKYSKTESGYRYSGPNGSVVITG